MKTKFTIKEIKQAVADQISYAIKFIESDRLILENVKSVDLERETVTVEFPLFIVDEDYYIGITEH